jgi:hypothetical protein
MHSDEGDGETLVVRLSVDGEVFEVRPGDSGGTHYDWVSGPNRSYGFSSSEEFAMSEESHRDSIRSFLSMIDPATGYLPDD